jgi:hypothetical protein
LLPAGVNYSDDAAIAAFKRIWRNLIVRIKGDPWKRTNEAIEEIRATRIPGFLLEASA